MNARLGVYRLGKETRVVDFNGLQNSANSSCMGGHQKYYGEIKKNTECKRENGGNNNKADVLDWNLKLSTV